MLLRTPMLIALIALTTILASVPAAAAPGRLSARSRALLSSKELWATIDVCNPSEQRNTLGVRGSMPGDGQARDKLYMSFRLQYLDAASGRWANLLAKGASTSFLAAGHGDGTRQDGASFVLAPVAGKPAFMLRGVVDFQWRRGRRVLATAARFTTAGHRSLTGADPVGYSAATCQIG